ncbi:hypothetical protein H2508_03420 [Parahaliea sp. F7430]|uniref:Uncharacterized protein n=1 Tax=Sediminihaliea albiluteola TaxID=2758564 RepID=A0A7W2TUK3_9GAMM|nr:hypothetical protein [Sediminihaliea albiluteola]MBA6412153.1 hypothetical protein [Sediminihaliea albiluteola]
MNKNAIDTNTKKKGLSYLRLSIACLCAPLVSLSSAFALDESAEKDAQAFCTTLKKINDGGIDTRGLPELDGHAKVLKALLDVSPAAIQKDMQQFHDAFEAWAAAVDGKRPMIKTFAELSDPSLAGAEGRVGDFIAAECGLSLEGSSYNVSAIPATQTICPAWPRIGNPETFNHFPNLPDIAGANYFSNNFLISASAEVAQPGLFVVEPGGWVEFHGQYPRSRYFAYHPNDMDLNNLPTLVDKDIDPDAGSVNPYRQVPTESDELYYTAKYVFGPPPTNPEPNTRYVGVKKDGKSPNHYVSNLLRLYASDIGDGANSGGVPLPAVTIYNAAGEVTQQFDECDLYANGGMSVKSDLKYPHLPIADHRANKDGYWSTSSNFEAPSDTLANADVQYLSTVYSKRFGDIHVLRAKYLSAPDTRSGVPVSSPDFDVRLYSICTYNIWAGHAIDCMLDSELSVDEEGYYTLVISDEINRPENLQQQKATWIDSGGFLDGQLTYRYVYRDNPIVQDIINGVKGAEIPASSAEFIPESIACTKERFEDGGWKACFDNEE